MVSGRRAAQAGAVTLGVLVLAMCALTVVLDSLVLVIPLAMRQAPSAGRSGRSGDGRVTARIP